MSRYLRSTIAIGMGEEPELRILEIVEDEDEDFQTLSINVAFRNFTKLNLR